MAPKVCSEASPTPEAGLWFTSLIASFLVIASFLATFGLRREHLAKFFATIPCQECNGGKLRKESMAVTIAGSSIVDIVRMSIDKAADFFDMLPSQLTETQLFIGEELIKEIRGRLEFLKNVGLNYLTLDRTAPTLSSGEAQRIRLASQIGSGLVGVLYILNEPTIGLHSRDNIRLLNALKQLRDRGNTVIVVEP